MSDDIEHISYSLESERGLDALIDEAGKGTAVLIGEATHGTSEFYKWRARITRRLIEEKGFSFVAVEGDWPTCYGVNRYVKGAPGSGGSAREALSAFNRWPTWLWANQEAQEFVDWLAAHNREVAEERRIGFYGLDVYSFWESLRVAVGYLENVVPDAAEVARRAIRCFEPYRHNLEQYAREAMLLPESCEQEVIKLLATLEHLPPVRAANAAEEQFNAEQNALVAVDAERYYRTMLQGDADSWNLREQHMANTFFRVLDFYERVTDPKGIIWAHNTHVGDARATDMADRNESSIGQLVRDELSSGETYVIGFGSYQGSVLAADDWGAPMREMPLPTAVHDSWEQVLHGMGGQDRILLFSVNREEARRFSEMKGHRGIGVVYDPGAEFANYMPTALSDRYDAFLHIDTTSSLRPLDVKPKFGEPPETFPTAV